MEKSSSSERKFHSVRSSRKRSRHEQLALARASKRALCFDEQREAKDEAVDSNTAVVQVEEVACEGEVSEETVMGLGIRKKKPVARKSQSELKINMTGFHQPSEGSADEDEDSFIIDCGMFNKILSNTAVCKICKDGSLSVIEVNKRGMARKLTLVWK